MSSSAAANVGRDSRRVDPEKRVRIGSELLHDLDVHRETRKVCRCELGVLEGLGPDPDDDAVDRGDGAATVLEGHAEAAEDELVAHDRGLDKVHRRRADERGDEEVRGGE